MCDDEDDEDDENDGDDKLQGCPDFLGIPPPTHSLACSLD